MNADVKLDPEHDDLPESHVLELRASRTSPDTRRLPEVIHERDIEAAELTAATPPKEDRTIDNGTDNASIVDTLTSGPALRAKIEQEVDFLQTVRQGYVNDGLFTKVIAHPEQYSVFRYHDQLLYSKNRQGNEVLCLPRVQLRQRALTEIVIDQAHTTIGHFGPQRTSEYICRWFWWPKIGSDIEKFCTMCGICQTAKARDHLQQGLLHSMPIPQLPWNSIAMDFVGPFPASQGFDYLWVIVCRLTSMVHLIPVNTTMTAVQLANLYLQDIVRLHGLPESIVSDHDSKFTSKFWRELHQLLGAKLPMSTAFHLQTDGLSERTIWSISQVLRAMVKPDQTDWTEKVPLTEFALNLSVSATTGFAPFELNYGYLPRMMKGFSTDSKYAGVREFAQQARTNLSMAHDAIIESRVNQTYQANKRRKEDPAQFQTGTLVYLSTQNLSLPKGRARKLLPKYIGPYKITDCHRETSSYMLELPQALKEQRIHLTFHASLLRKHEANNDVLFPKWEAQSFYGSGIHEEQEWLVDKIVGHRWNGGQIEFHV